MTLATLPLDPATSAMARLVKVLAEEAMFAMSAASPHAKDAVEQTLKRRAEVHSAALQGQELVGLSRGFDTWVVDLARVVAPIAPPAWLPMTDVIRERVTLEAGARGLRSLFSSKPSEKDVQRVKRLGTLAVRVLRAVLASDGAPDGEEKRTIAAVIASLGLPEADAQVLEAEPVVAVEQLDVYGEIEPAISRGLVRSAFFAGALDTMDPKEDAVARTLASKLGLGQDADALRNEAEQRVEARRAAGAAVVDAILYVLGDRLPGPGAELAAHAARLMVPRRFRDELLAQITAGTPVALSKRHTGLPADDRTAVLGVTWAAALHDDPSVARRAILRARLDRFAADIGDEGGRVRPLVESAVDEVLAITASAIR